MSQPEPPVNVKVRAADGSVTRALDCVYSGIEDGMHMWDVLMPPALQALFRSQKCDVSFDELPARTAVRIAWDLEE